MIVCRFMMKNYPLKFTMCNIYKTTCNAVSSTFSILHITTIW